MFDFINLIDKSKLTLIGYKSINEDIKDELISNLPNFYLVKGNNSSFDLKSILRDIKIDVLINKKPSLKGIVIDYYEIEKHRDTKTSKYPFYGRFFNFISNLDIKVIVTTPTYLDLQSGEMVYQTTTAGLYRSDLAMIIDNNKLNIKKSRFSDLVEIEL